ncbi:hypothetical protein QFZ36_001568 [Pseudarthrobacter siccitolerans]|uniref:Polysaccharide biosynthesis family protein n=1 Tax=Pseudarthrobacter siccitolerans TaxID=861266 RepID=A0ABU0PJ87_9MICC|nr:hypothetical protein [Pseudarthrobacter siccitolerans]MDQ0674007.1 hypothetical protein [Pseudarthrobacter siccitolerans]
MIIGNALGRIFGQALLLLPNFLVSITAAHKLDTVALAAFFIAWTIESQWIAGVRAILVPAIVLRHGRPGLLAILGSLSGVALLPGGVMLLIALKGGVGMAGSIAVALTPLVLGTLDCARAILAKSADRRSRLLAVDASPMVGAAGFLACAYFAAIPYDLATAAFGLVVGSVFGLCLALVGLRHSSEEVDPLLQWLRSRRSLLLTGGQEWLVFAIVGLLSIGVINTLAGPEAVAGIRLAETLLAPLGVVVLAVPVVLAPVIQSLDSAGGKWPTPLKVTVGLLTGCGVVWVAVILLVPDAWLAFVVGSHVDEARLAAAGLGLGAIASLGAAVFSMVLKRRNELVRLRMVRWGELVIAVPCVAVGALMNGVASAAASISVLQVIGAISLVVAERASALRRAGRQTARRLERKV